MKARFVIAPLASALLIFPLVAQQTSPEAAGQAQAPVDDPALAVDSMATEPLVPPPDQPIVPDEPTAREASPESPSATPRPQSPLGEDELNFLSADLSAEQPVAHLEGSTISVDFPDEEIRTILRIVADLYDLNLVVPEALVGRASIKLRNVSWRQVFDVVLSPVGYTYIEENNIIKVVSLEALTREPPVTEVIILNYARAEEIVSTLNPLVTAAAGGRIQIDRRSNALVVTERPTQMRRILSIIESLDQPTMQVMIESKFIETRNRELKNVGVNWASLDGYGVNAGPFNRGYQRENTSTRSHGREETFSNTSQSNSGARQTTGTTAVNGPGGGTTTTATSESFSESTGAAAAGLSGFNALGGGSTTSRVTTAVFSADQFNVILSALRTTNDVKLVSNPTVVTLNNTKANIHIGQEYPVVTPRYNPQTGTWEAAGAPEITRIGITLDVTPQVNNAGFITLNVEPTVSTLGETVTYFGAEYPIKITRRAHSHVVIRDGYTLAIGGLVQNDTINIERRVPVLGSLPGVGRLFRSESKDNDQRNLIIFITARTLNPDGSTFEDILDPRMVRSMGLTREEIPGYRPQMELFPSDALRTPPQAEEPAAPVPASPAARDDAAPAPAAPAANRAVPVDGTPASNGAASAPQGVPVNGGGVPAQPETAPAPPDEAVRNGAINGQERLSPPAEESVRPAVVPSPRPQEPIATDPAAPLLEPLPTPSTRRSRWVTPE